MLVISNRLKPYPYERIENDSVSSEASPYVKLNVNTVYLGLLHHMPYDPNGNDLLEAGTAEDSKDQRFNTTKNALTSSRFPVSLKSQDWRKSRTKSVNGQEVYEYKKEIPLQLLHKNGDNDWKYIVGVALFQFPDDEEAFKNEQRLKAKRDEAKQTAILLKSWTNEEERNYKAYAESLQKPFLVAKDFKHPIPTSQCLLSGNACITRGGLKLEKALLMALGWQPTSDEDLKKKAVGGKKKDKNKAALEKAKKLFKDPDSIKKEKEQQVVNTGEEPTKKKKKKKKKSNGNTQNAQPAFNANEVQFGEAVDTDSIFEGQELIQERTLDDAMGLDTGFINPFGLIKQQDDEDSQM